MAKKLIIDKSFVVKSNALVEARYRLSLQESQVVLWLLTQIRPDDEDFKPHRLEIAEFAKFTKTDVEGKYKEMRNTTKRLMQRVMEIYEPQTKELLQVSWLSSAHYKYKQGYVSLKFDPGLKPYLLQLKSQFTKINIIDTLKLKSVYAIRILELLLQYLSIGHRKINIAELRAYCGIEENEYADYLDLKRKVIEKAKSEITAKTAYEIDYKEIKESRKVVAIEWQIKKKNLAAEKHQKEVQALAAEINTKSMLIRDIMEYGYSKASARKFVEEAGEFVVKNALLSVSANLKKNQVKNPKAMLRVAIREKWVPNQAKGEVSSVPASGGVTQEEKEVQVSVYEEIFKLPASCMPVFKKC